MRIVVQARTSSSRLPGKALLPVGGMPLAVLCAQRLGSSGREVVLATSDSASDDLLVRTAEKAGVAVFRGSLTNVLERFVQCTADLENTDIVVRATADNPLPNGEFVEILLQRFHFSSGAYLGTSWPDDGLPYGLGAEVMTVGALRNAFANTEEAYDREHVTPWLARQTCLTTHGSESGRILNGDLSYLRATIDTLDDYLAMATAFAEVQAPIQADWRALLPLLPASEPTTKQRRIPVVCRDGEIFGSLTLGTAQLGLNYGIANNSGCPSDEDAAAMITMAANAGVTHLDTARAYGDAESRIGRLSAVGAQAGVKVVTKLLPMEHLSDDVSAHEVISAVDASVFGSSYDLQRRHLDVVMFHRSTDMFRWHRAALARLEEHMNRGVVHALGVSVYTPEEAVQCLADSRITHIQIPFNLLDWRWLGGGFQEALASRADVKVHVRSVFLQGLLINSEEIWPNWVERRHELVRRIAEITKSLQRKNAADLCIAYVRCFPWVTSAVLGAETPKQLAELLSYADEPALTPDQAAFVQAGFDGVSERLLNPSRW